LARLHRKTLCYSKSVEMLKHSIRLVIHYLKFWEVPVPYPSYHFNRALAEANWVAKTSLEPTYHTSIQQRPNSINFTSRSNTNSTRTRRIARTNTPTPTPIQTQSPKPSPTQTSLEVAQKPTNFLPPTQTYDLRVITNQLWGRLTKITFDEDSIIVTMAITKGRKEVVRLNVKDGMYLEDNKSYYVRYNLLPPSNNTEIMIKPGTTLKGQFVFVGWLAPGATQLSLKSTFPCSYEGKNGKEIQQCSGISFNIPIKR